MVLCSNVSVEDSEVGWVNGVPVSDLVDSVVLPLCVHEPADGSVHSLYAECACCVWGVEALKSPHIDLSTH